MDTYKIINAGFGGQGIMFSGRLVAHAAMLIGKNVSWLPSYGPEVRGGTANCHTIVSETPIGSPVIVKPNVLVVMNNPSMDKFEGLVEPGGILIKDSSIVNKEANRDDIKVFSIPATQIMIDMGQPRLANMVLVGKLIKETGIVSLDIIIETLKKIVSKDKKKYMSYNIEAIKAGYNYKP